jgi:Ni2+-binding GTPase involved in maturation of urease and hydrogenase
MAEPVTFVLVGGFLGAGKTTVLMELARRVGASGRRVGLITNDQAVDLVDTGLARLERLPVVEIAGACFCCKFDALLEAAQEVLDTVHPEVILAEPVGSCTDLSATVMQPIKQLCGDWLAPTPYTVLVDPERLKSTLDAPTDLGYLFRKQLEEADHLALNKVDTLTAAEREALLATLRAAFPTTPIHAVSALTGEGLDAWWEQIGGLGTPGARILDIDYDTYAAAEAALGWLNATARLTSDAGFDGDALIAALMEDVRAACERRGAQVGHVKLLLETGTASASASLVSADGPVARRGHLGDAVTDAMLTFNARVTVAPEELRDLVTEALQRVAAAHGAVAEVERLQSFRPGRPMPTHRFAQPVA